MRVQSEQSIIMLDDDEIPVELFPWTIHGFLVRTREDDNPSRRGINGSPALVGELHPMMRFTRPVGGRSVPVGRVDPIVSRRIDRTLKDEVTFRDTKVSSEWIAGNFRNRSRCKGWNRRIRSGEERHICWNC